MTITDELSDAAGLLGVELGRRKVRLALLSADGDTIEDVVEQSIPKAGGPRDPIDEEVSTRTAIEAGLERLSITDRSQLRVGATIGFANCGVGSGPALQDWLRTLSAHLNEPVVFTNGSGVSYAPTSCIDFVKRVFESTNLSLDRVELAPVAAAGILGQAHSVTVTLGSGIAWSARIRNNEVLEAFETTAGAVDEPLQLMVNGVGEPLDDLANVVADGSLCRSRGVTISSLAPSVGVAVALLATDISNLLDGGSIDADDEVEDPASDAEFNEPHTTTPPLEPVDSIPKEDQPMVADHWQEPPPQPRQQPLAATGQLPVIPANRQQPPVGKNIQASAAAVNDARFQISDLALVGLAILIIVALIVVVLL